MGGVLVPSQYGGVLLLPMATVQVKAGDTLRVNVSYSHLGKAESGVLLYAAIGNIGSIFGFDEYIHGSKTINVPEDLVWTNHNDFVNIPITSSLAQGLWDLYAKVKSTISPYVQDVIEMLAAPTTSQFGEITITNYSVV